MPSPTVSVIIVNYNTLKLTCQFLAGIQNIEDGDFEIIVVDNNSIERNPSVFLTYFPQIKLISSPTNIGFSKGNNLGIVFLEILNQIRE